MKQIFLSLAVIAISLLASCKDDTAALPDNLANFETNAIGIDESETSKTVTIQLSRAADQETTVSVGVNAINTVYGTDFTTEPAAEAGVINLSIAKDATSATFVINKAEGLYFDGDESIELTLSLGDESLVLGEQNKLTVAFASIVSEGSNMTLQGGEGGSSAINSVFVDFSNNVQNSVLRKSWNLGFYCGDEFAVILNNTTSSTAIEANIEINTVVSSTDSASYAKSLALTYTAGAFSLIDDWSGDLSKTIIKEGKVYVVNMGESQKPLYKVRVTKKDNNTYTLQYAKSNESSVTSLDITKNNDYHFIYVSFAEGKTVSVAPQKTKWDIVWSRSLYKTVSNDVTIPYSFPDLVLTNSRSGVQVAEVISASTDENINLYNSFTLADAQVLTTFDSQVDAIGSKWRNGGGPNVSPSIKTDRFYVVKDAAGNIYKLQFVSIGDVRGYPQIKYALLK